MENEYYELEDGTVFRLRDVKLLERVEPDEEKYESFRTGYRLLVERMDARAISKKEFDEIRNNILTK